MTCSVRDGTRSTPSASIPAPEDLVYTGPFHVTDDVDGVPVDAGKLVLSPTRTYAPLVDLFKQGRIRSWLGHCGGGGQTQVAFRRPRVAHHQGRPVRHPPLFRLIQEHSGTNWHEMYQVYNMGHRMEIYTTPEHAAEVA